MSFFLFVFFWCSENTTVTLQLLQLLSVLFPCDEVKGYHPKDRSAVKMSQTLWVSSGKRSWSQTAEMMFRCFVSAGPDYCYCCSSFSTWTEYLHRGQRQSSNRSRLCLLTHFLMFYQCFMCKTEFINVCWESLHCFPQRPYLDPQPDVKNLYV